MQREHNNDRSVVANGNHDRHGDPFDRPLRRDVHRELIRVDAVVGSPLRQDRPKAFLPEGKPLIERYPVWAFAHLYLDELHRPAPQKLLHVLLGQLLAHHTAGDGARLVPQLCDGYARDDTKGGIHTSVLPVRVRGHSRTLAHPTMLGDLSLTLAQDNGPCHAQLEPFLRLPAIGERVRREVATFRARRNEHAIFVKDDVVPTLADASAKQIWEAALL